MAENLRGEGELSRENLEKQKYEVWRAAEREWERIDKEINNVFATTADRAEAERIVLERYAPQMDQAIKKSQQAWVELMEIIKISSRTT